MHIVMVCALIYLTGMIMMSAGIVKELINPSEYNSATITGNMDNSVNTLRSKGMVAMATSNPSPLIA